PAEALAPLLLAGSGIDAEQVAGRRNPVHAVIVHRGGAARAGVAGLAGGADLRLPLDLAVLAAQGENAGLAVLVAHREDPVAGHRHRREALADARALPDELRPALRP